MDEKSKHVVELVCDTVDTLTVAALDELGSRLTTLAVLAGLCGALEDKAGLTPEEAMETVRLVLKAMRTDYEESYQGGVNRERPN